MTPSERSKEWRRKNKKRVVEYDKERADKAREIIYERYGQKCACCGEGEKQFLALDHINNDGNKERKKLGLSGYRFYNYLIKNELPDGYQILCFNCNQSKHRNGGECIHSVKRRVN